MEYLDRVREEDLLSTTSAAPWGGPPQTLFQHLLSCPQHLKAHQAQLFYYLKLQGQSVNTEHLWGA